MGNLLSSLITSAGAMRAFDRALSVVQNNVANATTPGFAKQRQTLTALIFEPEFGFPGGVLPGEVISYRDAYAERSVRQQRELLGEASQRASYLADVEPLFSITEEGGVPTSLTRLVQAFSVLSVSPNSISARQAVLDRSQELASTFNQTAAGLRGASYNTDQQIRSTVEQINEIAGEIRDLNLQRRNNYQSASAAGPDAQLNTALEELAELVNFTSLEEDDGTVTLLLDGQTPLVIGDRQYPIEVDFSSGPVRILDSQESEVTTQVRSGRLNAMLDVRNQLIPGYLEDLDRLAATVADRVNAILAEGVDLNGAAPSRNLFTYGEPAGATLAVNDLLPEELAAASADAPGGNGNALRLAGLGAAKEIDGVTFTEFFGGTASRLGRALAAARDREQLHGDLLAQAKQLRAETQGVSLDEEAAHLIEFQRAYQASAQLLRVLNELTEEVIRLL